MASKSLHTLIAEAIQQADKSYFFEDYSVQASAVLDVLKQQGIALMPTEPSEEMIQAGINAIGSGKVRPADHVRYIYIDMIKEGAKQKKLIGV
jgi:ABC-type hemin transport system substrate-binding protein